MNNIKLITEAILKEFGIGDNSLFFIVSYIFRIAALLSDYGHSCVFGDTGLGKSKLHEFNGDEVVQKPTGPKLTGHSKNNVTKEDIEKEEALLDKKGLVFEECEGDDNFKDIIPILKQCMTSKKFKKCNAIETPLAGSITLTANIIDDVDSLSKLTTKDLKALIPGSDDAFFARFPQLHYLPKTLVGKVQFLPYVDSKNVKKTIEKLKNNKLPFSINDLFWASGREGEMISTNLEGIFKLLFPDVKNHWEINKQIKDALIYLSKSFYSIQNKNYLPFLSKESLPFFLAFLGIDIENDDLKAEVINEHIFSTENENELRYYAFDEVGRKILESSYKLSKENKSDFLKCTSQKHSRILIFEKESMVTPINKIQFDHKLQELKKLESMENTKKYIKNIEEVLYNIFIKRLNKITNPTNVWEENISCIENNNRFSLYDKCFKLDFYYEHEKINIFSLGMNNILQVTNPNDSNLLPKTSKEHQHYLVNDLVNFFIPRDYEDFSDFISKLSSKLQSHSSKELYRFFIKEIRSCIEILDKNVSFDNKVPIEIKNIIKDKIKRKYKTSDFILYSISKEDFSYKLTLFTTTLSSNLEEENDGNS